MARTSTSTSSKKTPSKGVIMKAAEKVAKKAAKEVAEQTSRRVAKRVAKKEGTRAALNPDYSENLDEDTVGYDPEEDSEDEDEEGADFESTSGIPFTFGLTSNDDADEDEDESEESSESEEELANAPDIFAMATERMKKGKPTRIEIKRFGQFVTSKTKPYSIDDLQKEYGEGHYTIILKDAVKGTYVAQRSMSLEAPAHAKADEVKAQVERQADEKIHTMFSTFTEMQKETMKAQQIQTERLLEEQRIREEKEEQRRERELELMREQSKSSENTIGTILAAVLGKKEDTGSSTMMQMMMQNQQQNMQMMAEMNKTTMMMISEARKDNQTMFEKIAELNREQQREMKASLEAMSAKKADGFDPIKMFEMLNSTRDQGMTFGLKIQELARELADSNTEPSKPKSMVESIMENMGKLAPIFLANMNNQASQQAAQQATQYFDAPAVQHTAPAPRVVRQALPPAQNHATVTKTAVRTPVATKTTTTKVAATTTPAANPAQVTKTAPKKTAKASSVAGNQEADKITSDADYKQTVIDVCVPLIQVALTQNKTSEELGAATIKALNQKGLDLQRVVRLLTIEEVEKLVFDVYGLPRMPEVETYMKEFHDTLTKAATPTH